MEMHEKRPGLIFMATEIGFLSVDNEVYFDENKMESTG